VKQKEKPDPISLVPENDNEQHRQHYRALSARDTRFDGVFFTGVKTTGVYCRPICTAKTPKASSCQFFSSAAAAEAAGFRPCLRCRPELAPYALQQNLAYAIWKKIADGALNEQSVEHLSADVGLSSRQLRRVLMQEFGVSPVELAQTQRLLFAKKLLQETHLGMAEIAYAAGFGSVRRFNALFSQRYQMAPGSLRRTAGSSGEAIVLRLAYRPPYAWNALATYLQGRAMPGLEAVVPEKGQLVYLRTVRLEDKSGWIRVSCLSDKNQLQLEVAPSLTPVLLGVIARVREQFDLEANPGVIQSHLEHDPSLAAIMSVVPGLRVPGAFDHFELAIRAVLGQQVSVAGATTVAGRLVQRYGQPVETPFPALSHHFPTPQDILNLTLDQLAGIGIPGARAACLQKVAAFAAEGGLSRQPAASLQDFVVSMKALPGIGEWTAQYVAMRAMRYADAFPAGDLGLQKAAARFDPDQPLRWTERQLYQHAAVWSPWRAYGALLLWQSLNEEHPQ